MFKQHASPAVARRVGLSLTAALVAATLGACSSGSSSDKTPVDPPAVSPVATSAANQAPVAAFQATGTGLSLAVDGSGSTDADGTVTAWHWSFGDTGSASDSATGATATHVYAAAGTYTVTLTVTDDKGATAVLQRIVTVSPVDQAPLPAFNATPSGLSVQVTDAGSTDPDGTIAGYAWNFGEPASGSNTATGASATHAYAAPGTYAITLTVTDDRGQTATRVQNVTVSAPQNATPVAAFTADASNQPVVGVDASGSTDSDGTIASYQWDFGEPASGTSNAATGATASHTYASTGSYTVSLTVTDDQGATNTTTRNVSITNTTVVGSGSLQFRIDWTRVGDLDIVVALPDGKMINAYTPGPNAGSDFGQLDNDSHSLGPENVYWPDNVTPPSGTYNVCAVTYAFSPAVSATDPVTATLAVRRPSVPVQTLMRTYTAATPNDVSQYNACTNASPGYLGSFTMP